MCVNILNSFYWFLSCYRDWYNLEKSKRVKAFRCGEFDDCIEKAESAQGAPLKKREKYARREDAILHALELERQMLQKQAKIGIVSFDQMNCRSSNSVKKGIDINHIWLVKVKLLGSFLFRGSKGWQST